MNQTWSFKVETNDYSRVVLKANNVVLDQASVFYYGLRLAERFRLAQDPVHIFYKEKGTKEWKQIR